MRRYLAAGLWLVMTVTATLIVWAAVSVVAADVTDRPAPVVAHRDVVVALAGSAQAATTTTLAGGGTHAAVTATTAPAGKTATTASGARPGLPTTPAIGSTTTTTTTTPGFGSGPPTTRPSHPVPSSTTPPTTAPSGIGTATYSSDGGSIAVACSGFNAIRLVAALPDDGYQALVFSGGPLYVQVNFVGHGNNFQLAAGCVFGQPFPIKQNHPGD